MEYKKLLGNFTRIPISLKDVPALCKLSSLDIKVLNPNLNELMTSFGFTITQRNYSLLGNIYLTENGIFFHLDNLLSALCQYFDVQDDESLIVNLTKLEEEINVSGYDAIKGKSPAMEAALENYRLRRYMNPKAKQSTINRAKRKEFVPKTKRDIRQFKDFILNRRKYEKVKDGCFNEAYLQLYIACNLVGYAERKRLNNDNNGFTLALDTLKSYINNNPELAEQGLSFTIPQPNSKAKKYDISEVLRYIDRFAPKNKKPEDDGMEKYNYSFFQTDPKTSQDILRKVVRLAQETNNSEELKELLRRKVALYESLNYVNIKVGTDSFNGYMGFTLANGTVILDKLFENLQEGKIATDNAIFIIKAEDFEKVTKMTKTETLEAIQLGLIEAQRIIHRGNFEERVVAGIS